MNFLSRMGLVGHIVTFVIAALIILACGLIFAHSFELTLTKKPSRKVTFSLAGIVLAAAAVIATTSFAPADKPGTANRQPVTTSSKISALAVQVPHPAYPGNSLPMVSCTQQIRISGRVSKNDVVVTANAVTGSSKYYFVPIDTPDGQNSNLWEASVSFGKNRDGGKVFHLVAFALPRSWSKYLNGLYAALEGKGDGWGLSPLPPGTAQLTQENVRRKHDKCQ